MAIADKLISINNTKQAIKTAIEAKGVTVGSVSFATYPSLIDSIPSGGSTWTRPADWLAMPSVSPTEQKFVGLFPVFNNNSNSVALSCTGNYVVDWGDGFVQNVSSGVTANYNYNYSSISNDTLTTRGYKQVLITVTPQAGATITNFSIDKTPTLTPPAVALTNWLDIVVSFPSASITTNSITARRHIMLERINVLSFSMTNLTDFCLNMHSLREISLPSTSSVTNITNMFANCYSITEIPEFNFSSVTQAANGFIGCYSLETIKVTFSSALTQGYSMFQDCYSLKQCPTGLNTSSMTDFTRMFYNCYSLETVPSLSTGSATNMYGMFYNCTSLVEIPAMNTSGVTLMNAGTEGFCTNCYSLKTFPLLDVSHITTTEYMFANCYALTEIPALNFNAVNSFATTTFSGCINVSRFRATNMKQKFNIANMRLAGSQLNEVYTNLPTVTSKTITVSGNHGTSSDDPSIATTKGWTVIG